jgi:hypothetical protein
VGEGDAGRAMFSGRSGLRDRPALLTLVSLGHMAQGLVGAVGFVGRARPEVLALLSHVRYPSGLVKEEPHCSGSRKFFLLIC